MKIKYKKTISGILIVIFALLIISIYYLISFKNAKKGMAPADTSILTDSVYAIKDSFVNLFLLKSGESFIAVDAGNDRNGILRELKKLKIKPEQINAVLLTHSDGDHTAMIPALKNAKIYLSKDEEQLINGKTSRFLFFGNNSIEKYTLLSDDEELNINGYKIRCIAVPGHTPGAMCYYINDKYLFTGDLLSIKENKPGIFPEFFNMDTETEKASIKKLASLKLSGYIFTAHFGWNKNPEELFTKLNFN